MARKVFPEELWAGTGHSLELARDAWQNTEPQAYVTTANQEQPQDTCPDCLDVQGQIGVVSITGPLTNASWSWFGTTYSEIRDALVYAANSEDIKAIVLDIDSGGGAVNGCQDTANLVSTINNSVKPVYAFTGGTMCSAAYWLGCSAGEVYSNSTATVGSIGVLCTHMEYSRMMAQDGITATVMRAGEFKSLANPYEPLTDVAKQQMQDRMNAAYAVFIGHVADARHTTVQMADANMGQGREFMGQQAHAAGLVDGVKSFDEMMSMVESRVAVSQESLTSRPQAAYQGVNMKTALTQQQIAALASGAVVEASAAAPEAQANVETTAPEAAPAATEAAAAAPAVEAAAPVAAPAQVAAPQGELVAYLQGEVSAKTGEIISLKAQLADVQKQLATAQANTVSLMGIAGASLKNMKIALGSSAADYSAMSAEALLAEHAAAVNQFNSKFKAGGVAAATAPSEGETDSPKVDPLWQARVAANRSK